MRRLLIATFALCLLVPAAASAAGYQHMYIECQSGQITGHYSQSDYQKALAHLPADLDEYTDCRDVIRRAQLAAAGGGKSSGGSSGSGGGVTGSGGGGSTGSGASPTGTAAGDPLASATPAERNAVAAAARSAKPVQVAGAAVTPGSLGLHSLSSSGTGMPTSLIVLLALLAVTALGYLASVLWGRVHARGLR